MGARGGDDFEGIEPAVAAAARETIALVEELCTMKGLKFGYDPAIMGSILDRAQLE